MEIQSQARLTFHQLVDGTTVSFSLNCDQGLTQIKSKDPIYFLPDYAKTPQIITPQLFFPGHEANQIKGVCKWYINGEVAVDGQKGVSIATQAPYDLTLRQNLTVPVTHIICEYTHRDPATATALPLRAEITLSQVENAGSTLMALIQPKTALMFKTIAGQTMPIKLEGCAVRGGEEDITQVEYSWEILGAGSEFYKITSANAPAGSGLPEGKTLFANWNKKVITVYSPAILNIGTLRLTVKDTDPASSTSGKTAQASISLADITDPYTLVPEALQGTALSRNNAMGNPVALQVLQGELTMHDLFYMNKTLGFYRLTPMLEKDATWAPPAQDFSGWSVAGGEVKRTFTAAATTEQRTIRIKNEHLLPPSATQAGTGTTFLFFLEF